VNIIACVKQVPDTETLIKVKPDGSGIVEDGIKWVMNPYDEFGVEEALKLKEKLGGDVTIVSVGPARTMETIRTALAMGAEKGVHIDDPSLNGADAYTTAAALAAVIKTLPHDIIFCGQRAIDGDAGQVGSVLADLLGIPSVTLVTKLEIAGTAAKAQKAIEGATMTIDTSLPCVITTQKGLNEPRYASLPGIMKAKKKPVDVKNAAAIGITAAAKAKVAKTVPPPARAPGKILQGDDPALKAQELVKLLREEAKVI
jgi:electron transfer flavoprotein beta subunit